MTETNNFDPTINLLKPLTGGSISLGLTSTFDRERKNTGTFTITDKFSDLVQKVNTPYCADNENFIYPITGRIGIDDMVHAFFYLVVFTPLGESKEKPKGPPTLVDSLEFTTTLSQGISPKIVFSPVGTALNVADASFSTTIGRKDDHTVVVGLALESAAVDQLQEARNALFGRLLTASGGRSEQAAATAVNQFLLQRSFSPTINFPR